MNSYIQTLHADLVKCEELMRSLLLTTSDYEQLLALYLLYKKHQHTNALIDYANEVLKSGQDLDQLLTNAQALNELVMKCYQLYRGNQQAFDSIDNDFLFAAHIKPFQDAEKAEAEIATSLWKKYQSLSNRLDYIDRETDEFRETDAKCDAIKADYDKHHAKVDGLHKVWHQEVKRCTVALTFKLEDLSLVFFYLQRITRSIIDTLTKVRGE